MHAPRTLQSGSQWRTADGRLVMHVVMHALLERGAHALVELLEVAKARLDHGEQLLPVLRLVALRLGRVELSQLIHQLVLCLLLVLVRVGKQHDVDALLLAAHVHEGEDLITHHSRLQYVGPATISRVWQPERKMGRHARA